jgi:environmental stress-induced protein Ves
MAARIRHLIAAKYRAVPWRNGGGVTAEIAIEPEGAAVDSRFLWRLSLARIDKSGPFSAFEGYDRTIALVAGAGMVLNFGERGSARVDKVMQPLAFSGEWAPECDLIGGQTEDFNVMTDRARIRHRVEKLEASPTSPRPLTPGPTLAVFAPAGGDLVIDGQKLRLGARDTAIADGAESVTLISRGPALGIGLFSI